MISKWIFKGNLIYCENCNVTSPRITPYCPWCGSFMKNFSFTKCSCYHEEYGKPRCWGTREREPCDCKGDKLNCDFYPEGRKEKV